MVSLDHRQLLANTGYWLGLPVIATLIGFAPGNLITHSTLLMGYLCVVLFTSLRSDLATVGASALTGFLLFNFFHTQPRYSLVMNVHDELVSALVFIIIAIIAGFIAAKQKRHLELLRTQKAFLQAQVALHRHLQDQGNPDTLAGFLNERFSSLFTGAVSFGLQADGKGRQQLVVRTDDAVLPGDEQAMLDSLREQVQSILERYSADQALQEARRRSDEDRLRSALLSSVSHDLKSPLVTMMGAATSLRDLRQDLSTEDAAELLDSIISESQRLESYIQNLLDMTRLGHGQLALSRGWVSAEEIFHVVAKRIRRQEPAADLRLETSGTLPALHVHAALIEQGLFNVIDNALKAAGTNNPVLIMVHTEDDQMIFRVCDQGPGLPRSEWSKVFDPFHTFNLGDCYKKGTGLGLSICKGIFSVHGGDAQITAPPPGFRHCVELRLPLSPDQEQTEDEDHDQDSGH